MTPPKHRHCALDRGSKHTLNLLQVDHTLSLSSPSLDSVSLSSPTVHSVSPLFSNLLSIYICGHWTIKYYFSSPQQPPPVFEVTNSDAEAILKKSVQLPARDGVVRIRGLPYSCTETDVMLFFSGRTINGPQLPPSAPTGPVYHPLPQRAPEQAPFTTLCLNGPLNRPRLPPSASTGPVDHPLPQRAPEQAPLTTLCPNGPRLPPSASTGLG